MAAALTTAVFAVLALGPAPGAADEVGPDTVGPGPSGAAQEAARQAKPSAAAEAPQRIEVTGRRDDPDAARRRATAAKIVIDRQEIEAFGDSSLGEVLRRLPGITTGGTPGRGGAPRMRGLGSGYTRLLIDGEPIPPGFSLEQISP
ncbi:MAG TPA: TonB-dependent receptor plug domain-containing protein, partial [Rubrivivax sp.]|nr:TonB-dependent receptor plug domain-containing protein [Rubrivivax sp.]